MAAGSRVPTRLRYRHGDAAHARELLAALASARPRLLVTDGVFSMDGDLAPLAELARAAREAERLADRRRCAWARCRRRDGSRQLRTLRPGRDDVPVLVGTFGKAFGTFGAFVAGDADLIEFLVQKSRTYIYTTALPPAVAAATRAALARERARVLAAREGAGAGAAFPPRARPAGVVAGFSPTPRRHRHRQPVISGDARVHWR